MILKSLERNALNNITAEAWKKSYLLTAYKYSQ